MARYRGLSIRVMGRSMPAIGPGKAELLECIAEAGSISEAARRMDMSYRRAWMLVEALNASFQDVVVATAAGGKRGGGAEVTPFGLNLLRQFRSMEKKASFAIAADVKRLEALLRDSEKPR